MFAKPIGSDWPIGTPHVLNFISPTQFDANRIHNCIIRNKINEMNWQLFWHKCRRTMPTEIYGSGDVWFDRIFMRAIASSQTCGGSTGDRAPVRTETHEIIFNS